MYKEYKVMYHLMQVMGKVVQIVPDINQSLF